MHMSFDRKTQGARARPWAWGASLLAHGAVIAWLAQSMAQREARHEDDAPALSFVLVAPRPVPPPLPAPAAAAAVRAEPAARRKAGAARPRASRADAAGAPAPSAPPRVVALPQDHPEPAFTVATPAGAEGGVRGFDMAAARTAARAAGAEDAGSARARPLRATRDEKLGQAIEGARRGDCQTMYAGAGLLAVIPLVKDTLTGTGCKWQ